MMETGFCTKRRALVASPNSISILCQFSGDFVLLKQIFYQNVIFQCSPSVTFHTVEVCYIGHVTHATVNSAEVSSDQLFRFFFKSNYNIH